MANYDAHWRTNYFKVRDPEAFKSFCERFEAEIITQETEEDGTLYGCMTGDYGEGGVPSGYYDEDGEVVEIDFPGELASHLAQDWVAIIEEVGREKMRYLSGFAWAINSAGEDVFIDLTQSIWEAAQKLGKKITECQY